MNNSDTNTIKTDVNEEQSTDTISVIKREEYADLLLFIVNTMTSAIKGGKIGKKEYYEAVDKFIADIEVELVRTGEGSIIPESTLKKVRSFGRLLFNEYNRIKDGKE